LVLDGRACVDGACGLSAQRLRALSKFLAIIEEDAAPVLGLAGPPERLVDLLKLFEKVVLKTGSVHIVPFFLLHLLLVVLRIVGV
jgi:hypothetical protein